MSFPSSHPYTTCGGTTGFRLRVILGLVGVWLGALVATGATSIRPEPGVASLGPQSISFESNLGQAGDSARFIARGPAYYFSLSPTEATISLRKLPPDPAGASALLNRVRTGEVVKFRSVRLEFLGANPGAEIAGEGEQPGRVNYFLGNDVAKWRTGVPLYSRVRVRDMYPGISLLHYGNQQHLEYDFEVAPGADPSAIALRFSGADGLALDARGDLILSLGEDVIRQPKPVIYQQVGKQRKEIPGGYVLTDRQTVKFQIGDYDHRRPLVIDPVLTYSTYYGGTGRDVAWGVAVDANGFVYVSGETMAGLPTTTGTLTNQYGGAATGLHGDAFVAKFDSSFSNVIYLTYIGGDFDDVGLSLAVDGTGSAYVTGYTDSPDFPRASPIFNQISGTPYPIINYYPLEVFVTKLGPSGTNLVYSTFLGGNGLDVGVGIAVDPTGNTYVAGYTQSSNFPTANVTGRFASYSGGYQSGDDAFVTKLGPAGTNLIYSMFLGGTNWDWANDVAADAAGLAYLTGFSSSTNFPVTANALQPWLAGGGADAFVTVVGPSGTLINSTYLGGVGTNEGYRIALDADSNIYVTGVTVGDSAFPTTVGGLNPGGLFRSGNGGTLWTPANAGLQSVLVFSLAIDPATPARVYAGTARGIARSTDGGLSWNTSLSVAPMARLSNLGPTIAIGLVLSIAIDPLTPTTLYAGTGQGVFKSLDGGANWFLNNTNLNTASTRALVVDPINPAILYSGGEFGVYRSTNGATNWQAVNSSLGNQTVRALAINPVTSTTLYAATAGGIYRSVTSGAGWAAFNNGLGNLSAQALAIDPATPATIYVGTAAGVFKSLNGGTNWNAASVGLTTSNVNSLAISPAAPDTIYAGTTNGMFKSLDAGQTWTRQTNSFSISDFLCVAVNPQTPNTVFAGTRGTNFYGGNDVFVTKLGANGYSVVFGGSGDDEGWDVAVGPLGHAHIVGSTASTDFPTLNTFGALRASNAGGRDVLLAELSQDGSALLGSAYLGGSGSEYGNGIALDLTGNIYIVGETSSGNFPTLGALQGTYRGSKDAFIARIANISVNPVLGIQPAGSQVRLSWTALASDFKLQANTNLLATNGWLNILNSPVESNGVFSVSLPATNSVQYFRLSNP